MTIPRSKSIESIRNDSRRTLGSLNFWPCRLSGVDLDTQAALIKMNVQKSALKRLPDPRSDAARKLNQNTLENLKHQTRTLLLYDLFCLVPPRIVASRIQKLMARPGETRRNPFVVRAKSRSRYGMNQRGLGQKS